MLVYEIYGRDEEGKEHLIGILPERRKNPERKTDNSILNWGRIIIGEDSDVKEIYFSPVEID